MDSLIWLLQYIRIPCKVCFVCLCLLLLLLVPSWHLLMCHVISILQATQLNAFGALKSHADTDWGNRLLHVAAAATSCPENLPKLATRSPPHHDKLSRPRKKMEAGAVTAKYLKRPECAEPGCTVNPSFNIEGVAKGLVCKAHKRDGMINVVSRRCAEGGCRKQPAFNLKGFAQGLYCSDHSKAGMVNVIHRMCEQDGCTTHPSFSLPSEFRGRFCAQHAHDQMVDVINKRCDALDCNTRASYGQFSSSCTSFCAPHRKKGMVSRVRKKKLVKQ